MHNYVISAEEEAGGEIVYRVLSLGAAAAPRHLFGTASEAAQWIQQILGASQRGSDGAQLAGTILAPPTR